MYFQDRIDIVADSIRYLSGNEKLFLKRMIVSVIFIQFALAILSYACKSSLFADGAYFNFVIAAGGEWSLLWHKFVSRMTAYLLTVVPVSFLYGALDLSSDGLARLYSFVFDAVIFGQYVIIAILAWKRTPALLLFPVADYALSVSLGYGFPSEMRIASGFFWICMLLIAQSGRMLWVFGISFLLLIFSHELAMVGALIIVYFYYKESGSFPNFRYKKVIYAMFFIAILSIILLKLTGASEGGTSNAIYLLDPRRILNNMTLWLMILAIILSCIFTHLSQSRSAVFKFAIVVFASALMVFLMSQVSNFMTGRYDSARTLMGASMLILGCLFMAVHRRKDAVEPGRGRAIDSALPKAALIAALAVGFTSSLCFLQQWDDVRAQIQRVVNAPARTQPVELVTFEALMAEDAAAAAALQRMGTGYSWTWPFSSIMLSDNFSPGRIIVNRQAMNSTCRSTGFAVAEHARIPAATIAAFRAYACAQPEPPSSPGLLRRLRDRLSL